MKKPICFLALLCVLFSCGENLRFEQTQPSGFPELKSIPKKLRGTYLDDDSTQLIISKKKIITRHHEEFTEPLETIAKEIADDKDVVVTDSSARGFTAHAYEEGISVKITYDKRQGKGTFSYQEDKFNLGEKHVIKAKDGHYYINVFRPKDTAWILRKVVLEGDSLFVYRVEKPKEREALEAITAVEDHYEKDGEYEGWKIDPTPDLLDLLFDQYGERVSSYIRIK